MDTFQSISQHDRDNHSIVVKLVQPHDVVTAAWFRKIMQPDANHAIWLLTLFFTFFDRKATSCVYLPLQN